MRTPQNPTNFLMNLVFPLDGAQFPGRVVPPILGLLARNENKTDRGPRPMEEIEVRAGQQRILVDQAVAEAGLHDGGGDVAVTRPADGLEGGVAREREAGNKGMGYPCSQTCSFPTWYAIKARGKLRNKMASPKV